MTLLVKDANTTTQAISTQADVAGNLVTVNVPASVVGNVATPASITAPLPVMNTAGAPALDGSGSIVSGGAAQVLFAGIAPVNGYMVGNTSTHTLYVSDVGTASAGGSSMPIPTNTVFMTPAGYKPAGAVSLYGGTTSDTFAARKW
jgi:hypothetical protein